MDTSAFDTMRVSTLDIAIVWLGMRIWTRWLNTVTGDGSRCAVTVRFALRTAGPLMPYCWCVVQWRYTSKADICMYI